MEVLEPLAPTFGDPPSIPIGCNRLQSVATDREVWCGNGINFTVKLCLFTAQPALSEHASDMKLHIIAVGTIGLNRE